MCESLDYRDILPPAAPFLFPFEAFSKWQLGTWLPSLEAVSLHGFAVDPE